MSNLNDVFDKLIEKQKCKYETTVVNLKLKDVLNNYIGCCERYVKFKTGYTIKAHDEDFPFNEMVNKIDGVKFTRSDDDIWSLSQYFVSINTGEKTWFGLNKCVKLEKFVQFGNWNKVNTNKLTNELLSATIDKLNKRIEMLQQEMKQK